MFGAAQQNRDAFSARYYYEIAEIKFFKYHTLYAGCSHALCPIDVKRALNLLHSVCCEICRRAVFPWDVSSVNCMAVKAFAKQPTLPNVSAIHARWTSAFLCESAQVDLWPFCTCSVEWWDERVQEDRPPAARRVEPNRPDRHVSHSRQHTAFHSLSVVRSVHTVFRTFVSVILWFTPKHSITILFAFFDAGKHRSDQLVETAWRFLFREVRRKGTSSQMFVRSFVEFCRLRPKASENGRAKKRNAETDRGKRLHAWGTPCVFFVEDCRANGWICVGSSQLLKEGTQNCRQPIVVACSANSKKQPVC